MAVNFKPADCQQVIPYLLVNDPEKTIAFIKKVFGATESDISRDPAGHVVHASMKIGDSMLMMGGAGGPFPAMPASVYIYIPDVDAAYARALEAGAISIRKPENQFYGDRSAGVSDSQGTQWWIGTHVEDVSEQELQLRMQEAFKAGTHGPSSSSSGGS